MKIIALKIGKTVLRGIYAMMKLRPVKRKVTILSRQSNEPGVDIALLVCYLQEKHPDLEVQVLCRRLEDGGGISYGFHMLRQMWEMADSSVILLDSYCITSSILKHRHETDVIQMWHSMAAIKQFGYQSLDRPGGRSRQIAEALCMHRNYDHILCVSKATGDFYCRAFDTDRSKLLPMALPRVDMIVNAGSYSLGLREENGIEADRELILYAPTMRKDHRDDTKQEMADAIEQLTGCLDRDEYTLVICPHPLDESPCFNEMRDEGNVIIDKDHEALYWLLECDRVITDYSAVALEAAIAHKPLYFYVFDIEDYISSEGLNMDPRSEVPGITAVDAERLSQIIDAEYDMGELERFRAGYFETDNTECTARLGEYIYGMA